MSEEIETRQMVVSTARGMAEALAIAETDFLRACFLIAAMWTRAMEALDCLARNLRPSGTGMRSFDDYDLDRHRWLSEAVSGLGEVELLQLEVFERLHQLLCDLSPEEPCGSRRCSDSQVAMLVRLSGALATELAGTNVERSERRDLALVLLRATLYANLMADGAIEN